jgi:hypothetical protein
MATKQSVRHQLYRLVDDWERNLTDIRDDIPYRQLLDDLMFHADLRFGDYIQFSDEGAFPERLWRCLSGIKESRLQKALIELLSRLTFIDRKQMLSLHRDAYRRIISPWLAKRLATGKLLAEDYEESIAAELRKFRLFSITESFGFGDFLHVNNVIGLPKPRILGEDINKVPQVVQPWLATNKGAIVLEDFVGTGKQATNVLRALISAAPSGLPIMFIPLIIMEDGLRSIKRKIRRRTFRLEPVLVIPNSACLKPKAFDGEPPEWGRLRGLVRASETKVLAKLDNADDPPKDAFGYKGSGALVVTCYNTPNNTPPLVHHRAPEWFPVFRRVHHAKDSLR